MALVTAGYLVGCGGTWFIAKSGYAGAPTGGDRATVRYALGTPEMFSDDGKTWTSKGDFGTAAFWRYSTPNLVVAYSPQTDLTTSITCHQDVSASGAPCPGVLGVEPDFVEQDVLEVLGTPTSQTISNGRKSMHYEEVGYDFVLERLRVVGVRATPSRAGLFDSIGRFLIWLVP